MTSTCCARPTAVRRGCASAGVQSFTWQSSDGSSHANGVSVRLQKRQTKGVAGTLIYTLSKSMDNTTATGGNATVAQDDQNLGGRMGACRTSTSAIS